MNRNTSIALLLVLASLASVKALDLKRHIRKPLTATKVATLTPLREEQILGPRELLEPAERPARRAASGAAALKDAFADARAEGRAALIPYLTAGYPTKDETVDLLLATQAGGADVIEVGVPCADPFMDGPVISKCHEVARQQDVDLTQCLSDVMTAREKGLTVPVVLIDDGVVVGSALIRALNEGRSPYERRNIARTFVGRLAAATWAPRAGGF